MLDATAITLLEGQVDEYHAAALGQRADDQRMLLIYAGIALLFMAFISLGLGWVG